MSDPEDAVSAPEDNVKVIEKKTTRKRKSSPEPTTRATRSSSKRKTGDDKDAETTTKKTKSVAAKAKAGSKKAPKAEEDTPAATIDIGDTLPNDLTLQNEKGEDVKVASLTAEKGVVIFLVPKADTPGCTTQACGFRDVYPSFTEVNFDVYCLSADSPKAQEKWQTKKSLPYPLLSDPKRTLITALGAGEGGKTKRSHFIFEKGGKLIEKKIPVKPADSPKLALEFVKGIGA